MTYICTYEQLEAVPGSLLDEMFEIDVGTLVLTEWFDKSFHISHVTCVLC